MMLDEQSNIDALLWVPAQVSLDPTLPIPPSMGFLAGLYCISVCCELISMQERTHSVLGHGLFGSFAECCQGNSNPGDVSARFHAPTVTVVLSCATIRV